MEKFIGVLCCGGRGTRLGEITRYISKSFVPIYDRPVFQFGLELLQKSSYIDEIIILTNDENNEKLQQTGFATIVQDDNVTYDMFSGWNYIKKVTGTIKHGVLMPGDNISNINIDGLVELFLQKKVELVFSLYKIPDRQKLCQMGCYDPTARKFYYKHAEPPTEFGVVAPYIVRNSLKIDQGDNVLQDKNNAFSEHHGFWFDIGDRESIIEASGWMRHLITTGEYNDIT